MKFEIIEAPKKVIPFLIDNVSLRILLVYLHLLNVRGTMNCATTNGFFLNEKLFYRNGITLEHNGQHKMLPKLKVLATKVPH